VSSTPVPLVMPCAELSLQVAANRTFNVLPIVEGVYDMGNLAAIARSADGALPASGSVCGTVQACKPCSACRTYIRP
jgi:hypothetical protein